MFVHLRASRELLLSIIANKSGISSIDTMTSESLRFSLELYMYLVFSNCVTPYGITQTRCIPFDKFLTSTKSVPFPILGALLSGNLELYHIIPEVSLLGSQRLAEEEAGIESPSIGLQRTYNNLYNRVTSWVSTQDYNGRQTETQKQRQRFGNALRQALYIYLATAISGSIVSQPAIRGTIQNHVDALFITAPYLLSSDHVSALLWPYVIAGSCMVKSEQQNAFSSVLRSDRFNMKHLNILADLLEFLWKDSDPRAYGPFGLHLMMEKHGLNVGLA